MKKKWIYCIHRLEFNNTQMNDLIDKNPQNKKELLMVSGFGAVKVEKYGEKILEILKELP